MTYLDVTDIDQISNKLDSFACPTIWYIHTVYSIATPEGTTMVYKMNERTRTYVDSDMNSTLILINKRTDNGECFDTRVPEDKWL